MQIRKGLALGGALSLLILLYACGGSGGSAIAENDTAAQAHPGRKVYNTYCIVCHGSDGTMGANGAHNLKESTLSLEERILVITKGRNTMTAFEKVIDADKIAQVADYIEGFRE